MAEIAEQLIDEASSNALILAKAAIFAVAQQFVVINRMRNIDERKD